MHNGRIHFPRRTKKPLVKQEFLQFHRIEARIFETFQKTIVLLFFVRQTWPCVVAPYFECSSCLNYEWSSVEKSTNGGKRRSHGGFFPAYCTFIRVLLFFSGWCTYRLSSLIFHGRSGDFVVEERGETFQFDGSLHHSEPAMTRESQVTAYLNANWIRAEKRLQSASIQVPLYSTVASLSLLGIYR